MWQRGFRLPGIAGAILQAAVVGWMSLCVTPQVTAVDDVAVQAAAPQQAAINFEDDVVPIFQARCFKCHGAETRKAGLDLRRQFTLVKGGTAVRPWSRASRTKAC